jgi:hypothetical protein
MAKQIAKSHSECVKAYAKEQLMTEHEPGPCAEPATPDNPAKRLRTLSHAYDSVEKERNQLRTDNTDLKTQVDAMKAEGEGETVDKMYMHSDNCSAHFKNSVTMYWLSRALENRWLKVAQWSLGCPGHGKGAWDGLGAVLKRALRDDTIHEKILSNSRKMRTRNDVVEHLRKRFGTKDWERTHRGSTIKRMEFSVAATEDINRLSASRCTRRSRG